MNAEAEAEAGVNGVPVEDTPLPLPPDDDALAPAPALALAVFENPPSVDRDAESADVNPLRSALALVLALLVIEVEVEVVVVVEKRPDVSGLLEIRDAEADAEMLWLWLADGEDTETDALGTKGVADAAAPLSDTDAESESEIVGTPPVFPNDADTDAELTTLEILPAADEGERRALALALSASYPVPNDPEAVETVELAAASVEVEDSAALEAVDCAAFALVLCLPVREPVLELDEPRDALALAPDVVAVFVFVPAKEVAEAVTDSTTLLLELELDPTTPVDPTADVDVVSKLALAFAAEDKDDLSGALVEVKDVVVVAGVDVVVGKPVVVLACAWVALARLDSPFWSMADADTDAEGKVAADVVSPSTTLELELDTSTSDPVLVSAVVEGTGSDTLSAPKRRCIKSIGGIKIKKSRKLT